MMTDTVGRRERRHWWYQPVTSATKLAAKKARSHHNGGGSPKRKYTPDEAAEAEREIAQRMGPNIIQAYVCWCGWYHLGHSPKGNSPRADLLVILESGERVEACIRLENAGSEQARLSSIMRRLHAAESRRRVEARSPRRTTPLP